MVLAMTLRSEEIRETDNNSTKDGRGAPRCPDAHAFSCQPFCRIVDGCKRSEGVRSRCCCSCDTARQSFELRKGKGDGFTLFRGDKFNLASNYVSSEIWLIFSLDFHFMINEANSFLQGERDLCIGKFYLSNP
jgi:hypothetical protein